MAERASKTVGFRTLVETYLTFVFVFVWASAGLLAAEPFEAGEWFLDETGNWVRKANAETNLPPFIIVSLDGGPAKQLVEIPAGLNLRNIKLPRTILTELGIRVPGFAFGRIALKNIDGLTYQYDYRTETLTLFATAVARLPQIVSPTRLKPRPQLAQSDFALGVNYGLFVNISGLSHLKFQAAKLDLRTNFSTPIGVLRYDHAINFTHSNTGSPDVGFSQTQGDLVFSVPFQARRMELNIGDINTQSRWSRPVPLGGIQLRRDFGMDPGFRPDQRFSFRHLIEEPSTIDVFVGGVRQFSKVVQPGMVSIADLPFVATGLDTYIVITDSNGGEQRLKIPTNNVAFSLRPGTLNFSIEMGRRKLPNTAHGKSYGSENLFSANVHYGLADQWSLGAELENGPGFNSATINSEMVFPDIATASFAIGYSDHFDLNGLLLIGRLRTQIGPATVSVSTIRRSPGFRDLAYISGASGALPASQEDLLHLSLPMGRQSFGLSLSNRKQEGVKSTTLGINYATQILNDRLFLGMNARHNFQDNSNSLQISLKMPIGARVGNAGIRTRSRTGSDTITTVSLSRPMGTRNGDVGYSLQRDIGLAGNHETRLNSSVRTRFGTFNAGYRKSNGQSLTAGFHGAFGVSSHGLAFSNQFRDGFAIVAAGQPGIPVLLNGRVVGKTNITGSALVVGLRPYVPNRISIDSGTIPANYFAKRTAGQMIPHNGAGVNWDFGVKILSAATYIITDKAGRALPSGTPVSLNTKVEETHWVGESGQLFLNNLREHNFINVQNGTGNCLISFDFSAKDVSRDAFQLLTC